MTKEYTLAETILALENINKFFGKLHILKDVALEIERGEFITLLGPSGCGKTTTLRAIAGLEDVSGGRIVLNGNDITKLEPNKRSVNTVFQNYALFPHLSVFDNIAYGPRVRKWEKARIAEKVNEMLELVQMTGYGDRFPHQLSGGQRQRIAIARALINNPDILLLDEPLGALDLKLRKHMQTELKRIQTHTGITFIYVTHDQEEALNMSDRIVIMNEGVIKQLGTPREIYEKPASLFVAGFVGERNILAVTVTEHTKGSATVSLAGQPLKIATEKPTSGDSAYLCIHTDRVKLSRNLFDNCIMATVVSTHYAGSQTKTVLDADGVQFTAVSYNSDENFEVGQRVFAGWYDGGAVLLSGDEIDYTI